MHEDIYRKYISLHFGDMQDVDPESTFKFYEKNIGEFLPINRTDKILDIGVGLGHFLYFLNKKGYQNISGVDISAETVNYVKEKYSFPVALVTDTIDFLKKHKSKFNAIYCFDVIEHIPKNEHLRFLRAIKMALGDGGTLVLKTDNMSSPIGRYQYYMDFTHEYCYVELSLKEVLCTVGFSTFLICGEKYQFNKNINGFVKYLLQTLWFALLRILYKLERDGNNPTIFSKSLIAVCKK
jgi:2-polyprenyl-3-methyl-5-hydroxy-6-metoxy-1,4-benzoquinol methylase